MLRGSSYEGASDTAMSSPSSTKKDYRSLGVAVKASGIHVGYSLNLLIKGKSFEGASWIWRINKWLQDWCSSQGFGYLDHGTDFERHGLQGTDRVHLSENWGKRGAFLVISLPSWWWRLQTGINRGGEFQTIPLLLVWCKGLARDDWWGITGQQQNTWRAEQRNFSFSSQ